MSSFLIPVILAYSLGAIPSGYWLSKYIFRRELTVINGQMGTKYIYKNIGLKASITTFLLDFLKGYIPIRIIMQLNYESYLVHALMISAIIIGHNYSIFLNFKGGKGIAASFGCFAVFPIMLPIMVVCQYMSNRLCKIRTLYGVLPLSIVVFISIDPYSYFITVPVTIRLSSVMTILLFIIKTLDDPLYKQIDNPSQSATL